VPAFKASAFLTELTPPEIQWLPIAAVALVLAWPCSSLSAEATVVKIGLLLPPEEPQGVGLKQGVLLARDQANKKETRQMEVNIRGRTGQWGADGVEAARMVIDDEVQGLIAPPDGAATHLALQVSGRTAVPVVTLCADASVGHTGVPWMLRLVPRTEEEAKAIFKGILIDSTAAAKRWTAIVPAGRPGREAARDLTRAARECGMAFENVFELPESLTNAALVQQQALAGRPAVILVWLPPVAAATVSKELRKAGYQGILAGPAWLQSTDFTGRVGNDLEGFVVAQNQASDESATRWSSFQKAYQVAWHQPPDRAAGFGYDAAMLLFHLLQQPEFQKPPHHLASGFSWPGVMGDYTFDSAGNCNSQLELFQYQGGHFVKMK
jgi:ABC-type branched-subunit amino acid transport system substrate-binding protein